MLHISCMPIATAETRTIKNDWHLINSRKDLIRWAVLPSIATTATRYQWCFAIADQLCISFPVVTDVARVGDAAFLNFLSHLYLSGYFYICLCVCWLTCTDLVINIHIDGMTLISLWLPHHILYTIRILVYMYIQVCRNIGLTDG